MSNIGRIIAFASVACLLSACPRQSAAALNAIRRILCVYGRLREIETLAPKRLSGRLGVSSSRDRGFGAVSRG